MDLQTISGKNNWKDLKHNRLTPIEKFLLKQLCQASYFNIMTDECIDVATNHEEMSVFCTC